MPQFDTFSFFSQLFWVLICFGYLYLTLSFYVLPAFAIILKTRAKKLSQFDTNSNDADSVLTVTYLNYAAVFEYLNGFRLTWSGVNSQLTNKYMAVGLKHDTFCKINFSLLGNLETITIFI